MKLIIAGGRDFTDYYLLRKETGFYLSELKEPFPEIVSGGASGADLFAVWYAKERGLPITIFRADWEQHGKAAGPIRNEKMAKYADACICFWDGKSKGTLSMIDLALKYKLKLKVVKYLV